MNGKVKFMEEMNKGFFHKLGQRKCGCRKTRYEYKFLGGHWPKVETAVDPSLIEWKNLGIGKFSRFVR
jgi:hypothetical protein